MKLAAPLNLMLVAAAWLLAPGGAAAQFGPPQFGRPQQFGPSQPVVAPGGWTPARPVGMSQDPFLRPQAPAAPAPAASAPASDRPGDGGVQWPLPANVRAHPAVCRIVVPTHDGESWGSGTLIDVTDRYGLVLTNWHVVDERTGEISVIFPDGFRSGGRVLKVDRDWDLAAIAIWRPTAQPAPMATRVPQPGEALSIAGYGSGQYRAVSGRCTQYLSPGERFPFDMIELTASARQGDSGGPIFNSRGEVAGVLFGEGSGHTSGSHVGRVRWFLASVLPTAAPNSAVPVGKPAGPTPDPSALASAARPSTGGLINTPFPSTPQPGGTQSAPAAESARGQIAATPAAAPSVPRDNGSSPWPAVQPSSQAGSQSAGQGAATPWNQRPAQPVAQGPAPSQGGSAAADASSDESTLVSLWHQVAGRTPIDRLKTILAGLGILALASRVFRMVRK